MRIGYYSDTYVRTDDGWRLKTRAMTFIRRSGEHDSRPPARDRQARGRMTVRHRTSRSSGRSLVAWLDENDLTPPPGDHSLDAHQAQHGPGAQRAVRRGLDALGLAAKPPADSAGR